MCFVIYTDCLCFLIFSLGGLGEGLGDRVATRNLGIQVLEGVVSTRAPMGPPGCHHLTVCQRET